MFFSMGLNVNYTIKNLTYSKIEYFSFFFLDNKRDRRNNTYI